MNRASDHAVSGLWPALLTPVDPQGRIDEARFLRQAQRMLAADADGVTLFGSTGEGTAFSVSQRQALFDACLRGGIAADQLIVNLTACATDDAIALGRHAIAAGCAGTLFMPPFYFNQPRDDGVVESVGRVVDGVAAAGPVNLLLYEFPALSNVSFSHAAITELVRRHPAQVVGIKDSTGSLQHCLGLIRAFPTLSILVGAEADIAPAMQAGGAGSINGLANLAPHLMRRIVSAPDSVTPDDQRQLRGLLELLGAAPAIPFVSAYKTGLAEQSGDDAWLEVCPPMSRLTPAEADAVRAAYRRTGVHRDTA